MLDGEDIAHIPKICPQPVVDRVRTLSSSLSRYREVNCIDGGDDWRADVSWGIFLLGE